MASGVLFLTWPATAGLIVARVVSGVSIGMLTATATAYLSELHATARPREGMGRTEIVSTAANLGGMGLGPLLAGLLAQYAGHPLVLPYLVAEALMLAGAAARRRRAARGWPACSLAPTSAWPSRSSAWAWRPCGSACRSPSSASRSPWRP